MSSHERVKVLFVFQQTEQRILAAVRGLHRMPFRLKIKTKSLRKVRFIFDNQDSAHAR